jgi:hypothetical protein
MARNRIIYNVEGLYVAPYSGERPIDSDYYLSGYNILKRLEKVQNFNYSIQQNRVNAQGFGQKQNIFRGSSAGQEVTFNFSYIPDGVTNENRLNFDVATFNSTSQPIMFSSLCSNNLLYNDRDFYLVINKNDDDLFGNYQITDYSINPTGITDVRDPNSNNYGVLNFQNAYLNEYSFNISVGNLPVVNQSYVADNIIFYSSGYDLNYSILDLKSGINQSENTKIVIPKALDLNQSGISGQNILLPGDANISFYTNNITGVLFYTDTIQSLDYSLSFNRKAYRGINYKFPLLRKIEFPVNGKLNTSFIVKQDLSGSFFDTLNTDDDYNVVIDFNKCNNKNGVYPTKLIFSGCKFNNINYDSSIGSNKKANLSFNFDLDPDFGTRGLFISGNSLYAASANNPLFGTESSTDYELLGTENNIQYYLSWRTENIPLQY